MSEKTTMIRAILFDLDDTLIADEAISRKAMAAAAHLATQLYGIDPERFAHFAWEHAEAMWLESPIEPFSTPLGIHWTECLWVKFGDAGEEMDRVRLWATEFGPRLFAAALAEQGVAGDGAPLAACYARTRREGQSNFADAPEVLATLKRTYRLGLLTNGDSHAQRTKLATSGLGNFFDVVITSGEHGVGKPDPRIFQIALDALGCSPNEAVMVGNSLTRDIRGARNAKFARVIWLKVAGAEEFSKVEPDITITHLSELLDVVNF